MRLDLRYIRKRGLRWRVEKSVAGIYTKRSFDSLEAAIAYRDELLARLARERRFKQASADGRLTLGEIVDLWFNGLPGQPSTAFRHRKNKPLSPNTVKDFALRIAKDIPLVADHDVRELLDDPLILERFLHDRLTPENARKAFTILNLAFKAALRGRLGVEYRIPANPCTLQQLPHTQTTARGIPTSAEVGKILLAAADHGSEWDLFCRLTSTLGTRRGETCALRVNDFDLAQHRVHIDESAAVAPGGGIVLKPPKSWEPRTLLIPHKPFWDTVTNVVAGRPADDFLFRGWVRDPVLRAQHVGPKCWNPSSASHRFARMMRDVGIVARDTGKPYSLHGLRHYVATMLYNRSHDWVQVARFLGHKDPAITIRLYANHVVDESQQRLGELAAAPWWGSGDALDGAEVLG